MKRYTLTQLMLVIALAGLLAFFTATPARAAASSITQSYSSVTDDVACLEFSWVGSSVDGSVTATASTSEIDGWVFMAITNPGSPTPTASYNVYLYDSEGVDVMGGTLTARSNSASEQAIPLIASDWYGERFVEGTITLTITGQSVHSAEGVVKVYYYKYRKTY